MKSLRRASIALLLALVVSKGASLWAQTSRVSDAIQTFPLPEPQADDAAISDHKKVLRAEIAIDSTTTVKFYEQPTSVTVYNSIVSVERGGAVLATYNIGSLIKHQSLRFVHAALLDPATLACWSANTKAGLTRRGRVLQFSAFLRQVSTSARYR